MLAIDVASIDMTQEPARAGVDADEEPVIHLFGYDTEGNWQHVEIEDVQSYMYVPIDEVGEARGHDNVRDIELTDSNDEPFHTIRGTRVAKVYTYVPGGVSTIRGLFTETWESDIPFPVRVGVDTGWLNGVEVPTTDRRLSRDEVTTANVRAEWRVHFTDIEVDDTSGFPEDGQQPIICITAYDNFNDEYVVWLQDDGVPDIRESDYNAEPKVHEGSDPDVDVRHYDNEADMLRSYFAYLRATRPAVVTGWNSNDFDIPYLLDRAQVLDRGLPGSESVGVESISPLNTAYNGNYGPEVKGIALLDLLDAYKATQFTQKDSYRLESIGQEVVGVGKEEYVGRVGDLWRENPAKLVDYNLRDVELLTEIDRHESTIDFWGEVQDITSCPLDEAIVESSVVDRYILNQYHNDVVFPNQGSQSEADTEYGGGKVFEAINGIRENIATLDLASLYPMSMLTLNASPETKVDPEEYDGDTTKAPNGVEFRTDEDGFTVQIIEDLLDERQKKKDQRDECDPDSEQYAVYDRQQTAIKVIMNSLYGVMAWSRFRMYDVEVASATTATGRECITHTADVVDEMGYEVIYGDTDSVLIQMDEAPKDELIETAFEFEEEINESYDDFAREKLDTEEHWFDIEFEKLYKRYFQSGKPKMYAGKIIWNEGKDVDYIDITGYPYKRSDFSAFATEVQGTILEMICEGADSDEVFEYLRDVMKRWDRREVNIGDIGKPGGIGKPLYNYAADTHSSRAAKYGNLICRAGITQGDKCHRYYLNGVHPHLYDRMENEVGLDPSKDRFYAQFKDEPRLLGVNQAEQIPPEVEVDWEALKHKNITEVAQNIAQSIGLDWQEIESGQKQTGLSAFGD
jgi:DNA polymerase I